MTVVQINTVYDRGSTGVIARHIQEESLKQGIDNIVAYRYDEKNGNDKTHSISSWLDCHVHNRIARYTHKSGFYSHVRTLLFLRYLDKLQPDILHLHNLHGSYINIVLLFRHIRNNHIKTIWTFHDCWPFTGYCPYFECYGCDEWKKDCQECKCTTSILNKRSARKSLQIKKTITRYIDLTIVTPSYWLENVVKKTFYSSLPIITIHNGLDLNIFHPRLSNFREKYGISSSCCILLGVASVWEERKGLDDFMELAKRLDNKQYQIVLVGTNDHIDHFIPKNIISIHKTENPITLAEIYTAADVFINPTKDEVLGMVNIEANACGTPVITYNTGGSPECINDKTGIVVPKGDIDSLEKAIIYVCNAHPFSKEDCISFASEFDMNKQFCQYVDLYRTLSK